MALAKIGNPLIDTRRHLRERSPAASLATLFKSNTDSVLEKVLDPRSVIGIHLNERPLDSMAIIQMCWN